MSQSSHKDEHHTDPLGDPAETAAGGYVPIVEKLVRTQFDPQEVRDVIAHYPLKNIRTIREFERGSRRSPKVIIHSDEGEFLLKRRAKKADLELRAIWNHAVILKLEEMHQPVARLIGTTNTSDSMVMRDGLVYELFEYVDGRRWSSSVIETSRAGACLGQLHRAVCDFSPRVKPPTGTFHDSEVIRSAILRVERSILQADPSCSGDEVAALVENIKSQYLKANTKLKKAGYDQLKTQPIHGDWHPGNVLFANGKDDDNEGDVVAVIDFDASRCEPRVIDLANGMLHFAMRSRSNASPEAWPPSLSGGRLRAFSEGWCAAVQNPLESEFACLPWLMIEATIAESVLPIADTGKFSTVSGFGFLKMVHEKVRWIEDHSKAISEIFS